MGQAPKIHPLGSPHAQPASLTCWEPPKVALLRLEEACARLRQVRSRMRQFHQGCWGTATWHRSPPPPLPARRCETIEPMLLLLLLHRDAGRMGHDRRDHRHWGHRIGLLSACSAGRRDPPTSSADPESARRLAAQIGGAAVVASSNGDALQGADAVVLALRVHRATGVRDDIADPLTDKLVAFRATCSCRRRRERLTCPPEGSLGEVVSGWCRRGPAGHGVRNPLSRYLGGLDRPVARAGSPASTRPTTTCRRASRAGDPNGGFEPVKVGGTGQTGRPEVGGDLHHP